MNREVVLTVSFDDDVLHPTQKDSNISTFNNSKNLTTSHVRPILRRQMESPLLLGEGRRILSASNPSINEDQKRQGKGKS